MHISNHAAHSIMLNSTQAARAYARSTGLLAQAAGATIGRTAMQPAPVRTRRARVAMWATMASAVVACVVQLLS